MLIIFTVPREILAEKGGLLIDRPILFQGFLCLMSD